MTDVFKNLLTSALGRFVQDLLVSLSGVMAAHGWFEQTGDDQKFIGSAFFLIMLTVNYFLHRSNASNNAKAGALAIAPDLPLNALKSIGAAAAKGKL